MKCIYALVFFLLSPILLLAQDSVSQYNNHKVFDPTFFTHNGNEFRSADGAPGPKYWQNKADYVIHATLDEKDSLLSGHVSIDYTNNSPDSLHYVWLQLDQNLFADTSRGALTTPVSGDRFDVRGYDKGGYHIESVSVNYLGKKYTIAPVITDTRMQLRLPFAIHPNGDKININVGYHFSIPIYGADRMGRLRTKNGQVYELAQWYPRMCVYDDIDGWNTLPYMGLGEFYCEYGNFNYYVTAPSDMIVVGSGNLINSNEVLTPVEKERIGKAYQSDSTIHITTESEIGKRKAGKMLTWHFEMHNTRDVSWAASRAFLWDAARVNLPSGKKTIAMAAYPVESSGFQAYGRSTQYLKQSIEFYSKNYFEYPWRSAVVVGGVALGMEYPGIVFCSARIKGGNLFHDVTHEIGHNWFPMIVGSDEREFMWMDEGFNTFINSFASNWFHQGEYGDTTNNDIRSISSYNLHAKSPLMTPPEAIGLNDYGQYYFKTAAGLKILRNTVLGADRFDFAFKTYIHRWAFRHPQPSDFFRTMNDAAGENLNWFWKEWFYKTWHLDQKVDGVKYVKNSPGNGAIITFENMGQMALPLIASVTEQNGQTHLLKLPVEIWKRGGKWSVMVKTTSAITSVVIDPDNDLPDSYRKNNVWKAP